MICPVEYFSDCSLFQSKPSVLVLSPLPSIINVNDNVTLQCTASSVYSDVLLYWMVDGIIYNTSGVFSSSRGQLIVEQSPFDAVACKKPSSLTVLNVQSNSQGPYSCILQNNDFTNSTSTLLMLNMESPTKGKYYITGMRCLLYICIATVHDTEKCC